MSEFKEIGAKTAGGVTTYVVAYFATLTIQDVQAYAVIFASLATGIYYLAAAYKVVKHKKEKKDGK